VLLLLLLMLGVRGGRLVGLRGGGSEGGWGGCVEWVSYRWTFIE
jgi:hypothetical protein